jgi:glycosyltransferase involved in cell wall biosynthesis
MGVAELVRRIRAKVGRIAPAGSRRRRALMQVYAVVERLRSVGRQLRILSQPVRTWPLLDPYDRSALDHFLTNRSLPTPQSFRSPVAEESSARAILDLLLTRPDLRARFPQALRQGAEGDFARWLKSEEAQGQGVTIKDAEHMMAALARQPGQRVLHWYDHDSNGRLFYPLGLTPADASTVFDWLLHPSIQGTLKLGLDEGLWFLLERLEDPAGGLADTFVREPLWQEAVPHGLTRFGWDALKQWVATHYKVDGVWLRNAVRPDMLEPAEELHWLTIARSDLRRQFPDVLVNPATARTLAGELHRQRLVDANWLARLEANPPRQGVNVLAHFRYPSGLQVAARNTTRALELIGGVSKRDVPADLPMDLVGRDGFLGLHPYPVTLSMIAPVPFAEDSYPRAGLPFRKETYRIGYWYWELERVPRDWRAHESWLHELWAPTRFIAEALRQVMPMPVFDMLAGISMPPTVAMPRSVFGLPDDRFLFLFIFDMCSTLQRKNPLAVIDAFRRAFTPGDSAALAIKVSRGFHDPEGLATLREACEQSGSFLIDEVMSHEQMFGLMNCCDAYVSLHRSEGFGLTMAEAMALGKPVIATGYSGNLDFMNENNSLLVSSKRVPIRTAVHVYPVGCLWADPSVEQAADMMRWLVEHPAETRAMAERGRQDVHQTLSLEAAGQRMAHRLDELRRSGKIT